MPHLDLDIFNLLFMQALTVFSTLSYKILGAQCRAQACSSFPVATCRIIHCLSCCGVQVGNKLPRGSIKLELKSLKLLSLQTALRAQVEKEQGDIMNIG